MDDKMFELVSKMYSEMKQGFAAVDKRFESLENEVKGIKKDIIRLENDLKPKVEAALDGYKQNTDMLERIEKEVSRQDEIIMRRIK